MALINLDLNYITLFSQLKYWAVFGRVFVSVWAGKQSGLRLPPNARDSDRCLLRAFIPRRNLP